LGWVIPILAHFPNFVEGRRIHPAQPPEVLDKGPPQRLACRDGRERGQEIPLLPGRGKCRYLRRGFLRYGCWRIAIPNQRRPDSKAGDAVVVKVERPLEGEPSIRGRCW
jgi:hypothetical protein